MNTTNRYFRKINCFDIFKNNPFYFLNNNSIQLPITLLENKDDFEEYLKELNNLNPISLNFKAISETEKNLSKLLDNLINFITELGSDDTRL